MAEALNIHQRLAAAMAEVTYIQKQSKKGMQYTIVSHDAVTAKVRPVLLKHGMVYYPIRCEHTQNGNRAECSMTVRFANIDNPADHIDVPTFGYGIDQQDKGPGKAMSYAVKYALLKALGLETGDDPDHDDIDFQPFDAAKVRDELTAELRAAASLDGLAAALKSPEFRERYAKLPEEMQAVVIGVKDALKADLTPPVPDFDSEAFRDRFKNGLLVCKTQQQVNKAVTHYADDMQRLKAEAEPMYLELQQAITDRLAQVHADPAHQAA